jgi:hypothetical protein
MPASNAQHLIEYQTRSAQCDGAVGHIEGRKVNACVVKI